MSQLKNDEQRKDVHNAMQSSHNRKAEENKAERGATVSRADRFVWGPGDIELVKK